MLFFYGFQLFCQQVELVIPVSLGMGGKQHIHADVSYLHGLHSPFCFLQTKPTILLTTGAIPPHLGEFLAEQQGHFRVVEFQQVIHIAARGWMAGPYHREGRN